MSEPTIHNLVIVGSGPAGYTAALYAARGGLTPVILTGAELGGQLTTTTEVENYPGFPEGIKGPELMMKMQKQAERFGAQVLFETATKVDFSGNVKKIWAGDKEYQAKAVIIATGAHSRTLELPREKEFWGKGVHTCATCDGFFYKGKAVAVVGGGDSAMEESGFLSNLAAKVYVIHRGQSLSASKIMRERVLNNKNIKVLWNSAVTSYLGEKKLNGLKIKNLQTGAEINLEVDAIFFAIGHIPNTDIFKDHIALDEKTGYIPAREDIYTDVDGVFAAGDCVDFTYRQAVTAAGFGCMAAIAAERWLQKQNV